MKDIYEILSKHFSNETSPEEENIVSGFKIENAAEYNALKQLWKQGEIEIKEFDSRKPWAKVLSAIKPEKQSKGKTIQLFARFRRVAAVAAIIIVGAVSAYLVWENIDNSRIQMVQNDTSQTTSEILLSDGTKIWLNKGATLKYPKKFSGNKRNVEFEGEGYFEVAKDQKRPFRIETENSYIQVLGTSFNVKTDTKETTVNVTTGKVKVGTADGQKSEIVTPGMTAQVIAGEVALTKTGSPNYNAWKTGLFVFSNSTIEQVVADLNTYYAKRIIIESSGTFDCSFSSSFQQASLDEILKILELTCSVTIEDKGEYYVIK